MFRKMICWSTLAGLILAATAAAQDTKEAQNKLLAKRAAEADCYRKLAEIVYGLQLTSDTYVRDFVTESDEIRTSVDEFVKGIRLGPPRWYDDGTCEVDGEVTVAKLITHLKELHTRHYRGNVVKATDFEQIKQTVKTDVIRATGMGAPRPDVPAEWEDAVGPPPEGIEPSIPAIWKSVTGQGRLMAIRAAEVDAQRRLLERIKGLRLNSNTLVRDFVTEYDEIRTQASGLVIGAQPVSKYLHDDELIAEVTLEVPVEKVFTRIKELHSAHYHGDRVTSVDISNVEKTIHRTMIRETGMGVPPKRFLQEARSGGVTMPDWMGETLSATGSGTDPAIDGAQGKLKAARAAELDARRKLAEQIFGLIIDSDTTVRDFVTESDEIRTRVQAVLAGAIVGDPEYSEDLARVTVTMPAADVWSVVNSYIRVTQRSG